MKQQEYLIKQQIKSYLQFNNWFVFNMFQGPLSYRGISDLIAIKNGHVIFVEVKTENGRQSQHQKQFEQDVKAHGGHYCIAKCYEDMRDYIDNNDLQ
jgi:hypothetical protein